MKKKFSVTLFIFISLTSFGQIKDYFLPSSEHFGRKFLFESRWTNDDGEEFYSKNEVSYFLDQTGNYKKYIRAQDFRFNVPYGSELRTHEFYNISNERVAKIYSYTEGLSEELQSIGKKLGFNIENEKYEIILKKAPNNWNHKFEEDVTTFYKSELGKLTTEHASYDRCIIVTVSQKSKSAKLKWAEKGINKYYYVQGLGLVKEESYFDGKLVEGGLGLGTMTLVDNFSEHSFAVREQLENERIQAEIREKRAREELELFLQERQTKTYNYSQIQPNQYNQFERNLLEDLNSLAKDSELSNLEFDFNININFDLEGQFEIAQKFNTSNNNDFEISIGELISSSQLQAPRIRNYTVRATENLAVSLTKSTAIKKVKFDGQKITFGLEVKESNHVASELFKMAAPPGSYEIELTKINLNGTEYISSHIIDFRGLGGPVYGLLSLVVPGTGDHFVKVRGSTFSERVSPWFTTLGSLGLIGTGIFFKSTSNNNYQLYREATNQSDIDRYYDLANNQNKTGWLLIGVGASIWLADAILVTNQGLKNSKENRRFQNGAGLTIMPTMINSNSAGLSLLIKF